MQKKNSSPLVIVHSSLVTNESMQITIQISDETYNNFSRIAKSKSKRVDEVIAEKLEGEFRFDVEKLENEIAYYSDKDVLALANLKWSTKQDNRLSFLTERQREEHLTIKQRDELSELMRQYHADNLRKAIGIGESLRRGLIKSADELA